MVSKQTNSLADSEAFKTIAGKLNPKNQGYFYLNLDKMWSIYAKEILASVPPAQAEKSSTIAKAINGIAMVYSQPNAQQSQLDMLISLKPATAQ